MGHIVEFHSGDFPAALLYRHNGDKFSSGAIHGIPCHGIGSDNAVSLIVKGIDRNAVFHHVSNNRSKAGICQEPVLPAVQAMTNAGIVAILLHFAQTY